MNREPIRKLARKTLVLRAAGSVSDLPEEPVRPRRWVHAAFVLGGVGLLTGLLTLGVVPRLHRQAELADPEAGGRPLLRRVNVAYPQSATGGEVTLPATVQAFQATDLHARVSGYLKSWKTDIGARVQTGDVLAEIDTPELDRELDQAVANLGQANAELRQARAELDEAKAEVEHADANVLRFKADLAFAAAVLERNRRLVTTGSLAVQELESTSRDHAARAADLVAGEADARRKRTALATREAAIKSREATIGSREAAVERLRELQTFKTVVAPFDGIITRRGAEVGMLINAGTAGNRPLFSVAQADRLRVQVPVPQSYASAARVGERAGVRLPEYPGHVFPAKITRTAGAVDPDSRTLLVELELPNSEGVLLPGTFAEVRLHTPVNEAARVVPANVLLMRSDGPHVAVVEDGRTLRLRPVQLGRDLGKQVEVVVGLAGGETLVTNPTDDLKDGQAVRLGSGDAPLTVAARTPDGR